MSNIDPGTPVSMAELEQSDPSFASQVRRARRKQDAADIMNLARIAQQATAESKAPTRAVPKQAEPQQPTDPEPIWR